MNTALVLLADPINGIEIVAVVVAIGIVVLVLQGAKRRTGRIIRFRPNELSPQERPASMLDPVVSEAEIEALRTGKALTWRCDICKERRPDDKIAIHSVDISTLHGSLPGTTLANVKVCNDRPLYFDHRKAVEFAKSAYSPEARP